MRWPQVQAEIEKEEEKIEDWTHHGGRGAGEPYSDKPRLRSIEKAAKIANMRVGDVAFEIKYYAKRNSLAHSQIKNFVNEADFEALAQQVIRDKENLAQIYGENPDGQVGYRLAIGRVEEEWFTRPCKLDQGGRLRYVLSDTALRKQ